MFDWNVLWELRMCYAIFKTENELHFWDEIKLEYACLLTNM